MLRKLFLPDEPPMPAARNHWKVGGALACAFALFGCGGRPKSKSVDVAAHHEHKIVEAQEAKGLSENGDLSASAPSWSAGEDLECWYRDAGDTLVVATRSARRVLIHIDVNRNGSLDSGQDRVYAVNSDLKVSAQYSRPIWATAAWDEIKTKASVEIQKRAGSSSLAIWRFPKEELGPAQDGVDLTFEMFDERYQVSTFQPGIPFDAILRLKYSKSAGGGLTDKGGSKGDLGGRPVAGGGSGTSVKRSEERPNTLVRAPSIGSFQADSGSIERGASTVLRWIVNDATTVRIEPGIGVLQTRGERTVSPDQTTSYTLIAEGPGGTASSQFTVNVVVVPPPSIATFQGDSATIQPGASTTLRWSVSGRATTVRIDPGLGTLPMQGSREVSPERTTQYTLAAQGPGGSVAGQFTVRVAARPPVIMFEADPRSVSLGQSAIVRWNVSGAARVSITPDIGGVTAVGSATVKPLSSARYTLTAEGPGGIETRDVAITVQPARRSSGELIWAGIVRGSQLITIDKDRADVGTIQGSLPGVPCIVQPVDERHVSIASTPAPRNNYERLVIRVTGNGMTRVVIKWSLL